MWHRREISEDDSSGRRGGFNILLLYIYYFIKHTRRAGEELCPCFCLWVPPSSLLSFFLTAFIFHLRNTTWCSYTQVDTHTHTHTGPKVFLPVIQHVNNCCIIVYIKYQRIFLIIIQTIFIYQIKSRHNFSMQLLVKNVFSIEINIFVHTTYNKISLWIFSSRLNGIIGNWAKEAICRNLHKSLGLWWIS